MSARHCLLQDKDPNKLSVVLDSQVRSVQNITLHPRHLERVDVMMLLLDKPFTNIDSSELPFWPDDNDDLYGQSLLCAGYGGTQPNLTFGWFTPGPDSDDSDMFYNLAMPNQWNQSLIGGDSGSTCRRGQFITGVHKASGRQVSAEAWRDWAEKRRDCPGFNPNFPATSFCSTACPCDVGEGDCDSNAQCQPGLQCRSNVGGDFGLPSTYDVCDRADPGCAGFNPATAPTDFCSQASPICPCQHGEGDCDDDNDCGGSLECQRDTGQAVGLPSNYDVCVYPAAPNCPTYVPTQHEASFCTTTCPCDIGQGDCDSNSQCRGGLVCRSNVGATYGKPPAYDICERP